MTRHKYLLKQKNEINLHLMKNNSECINSLATAKDGKNIEKLPNCTRDILANSIATAKLVGAKAYPQYM